MRRKSVTKARLCRAALAVLPVAAASGAARADVFSSVPGLDGYSVVYTQQIANAAGNSANLGATPYIQDFSAAFAAGSFTRVGYYLELQSTTAGAPLTYAYAEFDAAGFTTNPALIGVPTNATTQVFQQNVSNMRVVSNVAGVVNGTNLTTGNIEFWPHNYSQANGASVPGASATTYDFGDTRSTTAIGGGTGHGSMQIHNYGANQTVLSYGHWGNAGNQGATQQMDLGIGNSTSASAPDWTLTNNTASYAVKNLQVVVNTPRPKPALALASGVPAPVAANVPAAETNGYQLVYQANLPTANAFSATNYVINNASQVANGSFGRIAYYLELKDNAGTTKWVWVSADAFTGTASKIGVPLSSTGALFQGKLTAANVYASANSGIAGGTSLSSANIEFWPTNYTQQDQLGVAGSSNTTFDVGDEITPGNFGSMQIHAAGQTLFAFNHWGGAAGTNDLGIGNSPTGSPDWTQTASGANYTSGSATLYVFVSPVPEPTAAAAAGAVAGLALLRRRRRARA